MNSHIFYFTDSLRKTVAVVGTGGDRAEAEVDARAKWDTAVSGRDDYSVRSPIVECVDSGIATTIDGEGMTGLIL